MRNVIALCPCLLVLFVAACGGGLESEECKAYFEKVESCTSSMDNEIKADALRKTAEASKAEWEKNSNALAVKTGCEMMREQLDNDPDCKKGE